jgi:hypothetical protein
MKAKDDGEMKNDGAIALAGVLSSERPKAF